MRLTDAMQCDAMWDAVAAHPKPKFVRSLFLRLLGYMFYLIRNMSFKKNDAEIRQKLRNI